MSLFSSLSRFFKEHPVDNLTFDWNGEPIQFADWPHDAYGSYQYTTRNRRHHFEFDLEPVDGEVRIYITKQPSYRGRRSGGHPTHRKGLEHGKPYVCIDDGLEPDNVPDALSWLIYWAENTGDYIDTGKEFT